MTPLVLIPGLLCDARLFAPVIAAFGAERPVTVADISKAEDMGTLAELVLAAAPGRFALAGLSMGGIVAMEMLARAPGRIERLALLDTNPLAEAAAMRARRIDQIERARAGQLDAIMRDELKPGYLSPGPHRAAIAALCMEMALDLGLEVFVRQSRALMGRPDQTATLRAARLPALVLCGAEDALCPVERHEMMAGLIDGAELVVIPGVGHLTPLEAPEATVDALREWLAWADRPQPSSPGTP